MIPTSLLNARAPRLDDLWRTVRPDIRLIALLCPIYFAADVLLNRVFSDGWTIIWPLNGVNIALLLVWPRRRWPAILVGIEIGTFLGQLLEPTTIGMEVAQRAISVIEVLLSALVLPAFVTVDQWFQTPRLFSRFLAAIMFGPCVSGMLAAVLFYSTQGQPFLTAFNNWATCDAVGITATLPVALVLKSRQMRELFMPSKALKTVIVLCVAYFGAALIFSVTPYPTILFCLYPMLLFVDAMLAFAGSALAIVGICMISLYCASHGLGPFGQWPSSASFSRDFWLQMYFGFHVIALFPASILSMERKRLTTELQQTNARLAALASLDGLTGIANRRTFDEKLAEEWHRAHRAGLPLTCALIDLDFFKQFNDRYGHQAGDRCLVAVAKAIASQARRLEDLAARYGGEEFVLLLSNISLEGARKILENVQRVIAELGIEHAANESQRVTVSVGFATLIPTQHHDAGELLKLADASLYLAKSAGRNRIETLAALAGPPAAVDFSATARLRVKRILGTER